MRWEYLETIYYPATESGKKPGWYEYVGFNGRRIADGCVTDDTSDLFRLLGLEGWLYTGSGRDLIGNKVLIWKREVQ